MGLLVNKITLSQDDKQSFSENGFIKLKKLFTSEATAQLRKLTSNSNQMKNPPRFYSGEVSKIGYDVEERVTHDIYSSRNFQYVMKQLAHNGLTFMQGIAFEIKANQKGFPWHHDIYSFCYIRPEDLGYTLWIPLDPINTKEQHGGMAYVSRQVYSAREYFNFIYQLVQQNKFEELLKTEDLNNYDFQFADHMETFLLENNQLEDDFEVGDALLLDKFVWHKSCALKAGPLPSRMAYVMRFVDSQSRHSKVLLEGTYSLIEATSKDVQTDLGYKMAKVLKDGEIIPHNFVSLKRS
ncbi:hypothetical protein [Moorena producens]|uniref:hypothetical protein n=1 Tax=Moorena producens TaxID=1155739 RepID=UPI003C76813C